MTFRVLVHDAVWRELPAAQHTPAREAMRALAGLSEPSRSPDVRLLAACAYPHSYRIRVGRARLLFALFPDARAIVFTTAFVKRRGSDYAIAIARHERRIAAYE